MMHKPLRPMLSLATLLTLAALACSLSLDTPVAQNNGIIGGTVTSDTGDGPLVGAILSLSGCGEDKSAVSGADGSFQFTGLPAGVCVLQVTKDGWSYSASFPKTDYPIPVAVEADKPSALVIYMRPAEQAGPTPAIAEPTSTLVPTDSPLSATPTATFTPSVPMVAAIDRGVNCRFGPSTKYLSIDGLLVGNPVPITGGTEDGNWWQIATPSGGSGKCFVSASVTQASGNLNGIPVVQAPQTSVTDVQLSVKVIEKQLCKEAIVDVSAKITVNGPTEVSYHYAVTTPSTTNEVAFTTVQYPEAGAYPIEFQEAAAECGDHSLTLVVTDPNQDSARADFTVKGTNVP